MTENMPWVTLISVYSVSIYIHENIIIYFFFTREQISTLYIDKIFISHLSVNKHIDLYHYKYICFLATVNMMPINMTEQVKPF